MYFHAFALQLDKANSKGGVQGVGEMNSNGSKREGDSLVTDGDDGPNWCDLEQLLDVFEKRTGRRAVYSICFY